MTTHEPIDLPDGMVLPAELALQERVLWEFTRLSQFGLVLIIQGKVCVFPDDDDEDPDES